MTGRPTAVHSGEISCKRLSNDCRLLRGPDIAQLRDLGDRGVSKSGNIALYAQKNQTFSDV